MGNKNNMMRLLLLMLFGVVFVGGGCGAPAQPEDATMRVAATQFLSDMVQDRDDAMLSGNIVAYTSLFESAAWPSRDAQTAEFDPSVLSEFRARLREQGSDLARVTSTLDVKAVSGNASELDVRFEVNSNLYFVTSGRQNPEAAIERTPLSARLHRDSNGSFSIEWLRSPSAPVLPATSVNIRTPSELGIAPTFVGSRIEVSDDSGITQFAYYASAAASYADAWATRYNPSFRQFESGYGGDCTNFVSQCLLAGGRAQNTGLYTSMSAWWYTSFTQTYTWTSAKYLFNNLTQFAAGQSIADLAYATSGDVVFADWGPVDRVIDHAMIVSQRICSGSSASCVLIDQHSNFRYRFPLSNTLALAPGTQLYVVRLVN